VSIFSTTLLAPNVPTTLYIEETKSINAWEKYESLADAVYLHESNRNPLAYNKLEDAVGGFQIRECRLKHYNRLTGCNYTHEDMYDYNIARKVFLYFAVGQTFEQAAKSWNGSGPLTIKYWDAVKAILGRNI
jgi:hypothetical protein